MEKIRIKYDKVSKFNPHLLFVLDSSSLQNYINGVWAEITGTEIRTQEPPKTKFVSREEEYLSGAIEVNNLNLYEGEIVVPQEAYISGYQDLSFDEFCSYIYWRTLIRNQKTHIVPGGFLALYLIEIVNFVEVSTYLDGLNLLKYIKQLSEDNVKNLNQINRAIEEYVILYGSISDVYEHCDFAQFNYIFEDNLIYRREHPCLLSTLSEKHYSQLKKSKIWERYSQILEKKFDEYFYAVADYLENKNIPFLKLYVGTPKLLSFHKVYLKRTIDEKLVDKEIVHDGIRLISVKNVNVQKASKSYQDETDQNKGYFFVRGHIIKYILRLYEKEMRELLGYPKIKAELKIVNERVLEDKFVRELFEIVNSEEFKQIFNQVQNI